MFETTNFVGVAPRVRITLKRAGFFAAGLRYDDRIGSRLRLHLHGFGANAQGRAKIGIIKPPSPGPNNATPTAQLMPDCRVLDMVKAVERSEAPLAPTEDCLFHWQTPRESSVAHVFCRHEVESNQAFCREGVVQTGLTVWRR